MFVLVVVVVVAVVVVVVVVVDVLVIVVVVVLVLVLVPVLVVAAAAAVVVVVVDVNVFCILGLADEAMFTSRFKVEAPPRVKILSGDKPSGEPIGNVPRSAVARPAHARLALLFEAGNVGLGPVFLF